MLKAYLDKRKEAFDVAYIINTGVVISLKAEKIGNKKLFKCGFEKKFDHL